MSIPIHQYSAASPDLDADTLAQLAESIRVQGQLVPILVWRGEVLDGRKRLAACERIGVAPRIETLDDAADGARIAIDANVLRTHYTPSQRAMFAAGIATATRSEAAKAWRAKEQDAIAPGTAPTMVEAANLLGVNRVSVMYAKRIARTADPAVTDAVRRGELTLHAAKVIADSTPREEQPRVTAEVVASKKGGRNTPASIISAVSEGIRRPPRRDATAAVHRGLESMNGTVAALGEILDAAQPTATQAADWRTWLSSITKVLRRVERHIAEDATNGPVA